MNRSFTKVLNKILLGVRITKPNSIRDRKRRRRSRRRTTTCDRVLGRNKLFGCHSQEIREEKKENIAEENAWGKKEKRGAMHGNA